MVGPRAEGPTPRAMDKIGGWDCAEVQTHGGSAGIQDGRAVLMQPKVREHSWTFAKEMQRNAYLDFRRPFFFMLSLTSLAPMRASAPMSDPPVLSSAPRCVWEPSSSESLPRIAASYCRMLEAGGPKEAGRRSPSQDGMAVLLEQPSWNARAAGTLQAKATSMHVLFPKPRRLSQHARNCATIDPDFLVRTRSDDASAHGGGALTSRRC